MAQRPANRRRQRSVRIAVAGTLLGAATVGALAALIAQSSLWLSVALVVTLVCGWASTRIVCTEVLQARRQSAVAVAQQAHGYQVMAAQRAEENIAFSALMSQRVEERDRSISELEGTVRLAEMRATVAESRAGAESRRADDAHRLLLELQDERAAIEAEYLAERDEDPSTVVDLMGWEERIISQGNHRKHA